MVVKQTRYKKSTAESTSIGEKDFTDSDYLWNTNSSPPSLVVGLLVLSSINGQATNQNYWVFRLRIRIQPDPLGSTSYSWILIHFRKCGKKSRKSRIKINQNYKNIIFFFKEIPFFVKKNPMNNQLINVKKVLDIIFLRFFFFFDFRSGWFRLFQDPHQNEVDPKHFLLKKKKNHLRGSMKSKLISLLSSRLGVPLHPPSPSNRLFVPSSLLFVPSSRLFVPSSQLFVPSSRLFVPSSRLLVSCP